MSEFVPGEDVRAVVNRSGRVAHLLERETMSEAQRVYETIKPEDPPPPDDNGGGDGGDDGRKKFSAAAVVVSLMFVAGGCYLLVIGVRGIRNEMRLMKGGK